MNKIAIVGTGFVGSTTAYTLALSSTVTEIVLLDVNKDKAEGDALDISHAMPLINPLDVYAGDYADVKDAAVIIIAAGLNSKPGETRLDLVHKNTDVFKQVIPSLLNYNSNAIYLVVTNPVDILTYVTQKISGLPAGKVIGSGTILDSSRFRYLLSELLNIDARNIHAYMLGEHGDSELPAWSIINIAGYSLDEYCNQHSIKFDEETKKQIESNVVNAAYQIISRKGATYYAVAIAVKRIVECILRDEHSILSVSSLLDGQYGVHNVCASLPSIVARDGVLQVLELPISDEEIMLFKRSTAILAEIIKVIKF